MDIQKTFSANMKAFRKKAGLTQEELAERSGLHRTYIGGIEQRRINVSLKNVSKLAEALDVDPALLFLQDPETHIGKNGKPDFAQGDWALCEWNDKGIVLHPIHEQEIEFSQQILYMLIKDDFSGDELVERFHHVQSEMLDFYRQTKR